MPSAQHNKGKLGHYRTLRGGTDQSVGDKSRLGLTPAQPSPACGLSTDREYPETGLWDKTGPPNTVIHRLYSCRANKTTASVAVPCCD